MQLQSISSVENARVVTGGELVETELDDSREHEVEAHERIAADARVRGPALEVVAMKRLDDALAELRLQVPAVVRNIQQVRDSARILDRRERAAPAVSGGFFAVVAGRLLQGDPDDLVPLSLEQSRGNRHRNRNSHVRFPAICLVTTSASSPTP